MNEPTPTSENDTRKPNVRAWLIALSVLVAITFIVAIAALSKSYQQLPARDAATGTWYCETATGGQTKVANPANCGPNDLVGWCDIWEDGANGDPGKCVG